MLLKDRTAIITGAASPRGLGKATAQLFAEHGARVAILDLKGAAEAAADLPGDGHLGADCSVTDRDAIFAAIEDLAAGWGRVDVLVNIAGITQPLRTLEIAPENYDAVLDVNLRGTLYASQAVIPVMRALGGGSIVNMSSVSAQRGGGIFGGPHYSAAKAGVLGLTKAKAGVLGSDNIRVNAICPSLIATDITGGKLSDADMAAIVAGIPLGRPGAAHEVAGCALFLASDLSSYCTGTEIDVNGGSHIH
ncbi:SDR family oxidoreductase [Phaeovulum vinaykumarii]|uniref:NAD(P)-dependent dehydrogenase, short-chain alcohol dehydrogenase family n=1 Tax=Phaeovulum vinaykumarii TaxID=407234 RepID=A0A1N7M8P5_9RHOB|nr:SDR family NAD(P)-dependent oxidoreductase [Phaeovulum vinaykumarii]SIS82485.1 NAD(P)-dependent dehydrogenase, short-chain alcohol dehydrogenase family [Phaeovulum vinaykumarii]SOC10946.1 NAD(P)-dependent dehydrogenase (short-subunit alcohol dehydrogenase family) [Phaeovulum vinaykumarii]